MRTLVVTGVAMSMVGIANAQSANDADYMKQVMTAAPPSMPSSGLPVVTPTMAPLAPPRSSRMPWLVGGAVGVLLLGGIGWMALRKDGNRKDTPEAGVAADPDAPASASSPASKRAPEPAPDAALKPPPDPELTKEGDEGGEGGEGGGRTRLGRRLRRLAR